MTVDDFASQSSTGPRNLLRSIGAVFAGLVVIVVLSIATDQVFHSLGVYPPWGEPMLDTWLCLLAISYRCVFTVAGGWLTAMLAPGSPVRHAMILGAIGLVMGTLGGIAGSEMAPVWFLVAIPVTGFLCAWLGGHLYAIGQTKR